MLKKKKNIQLKNFSNINFEGTSEKSETPKLQSKKLMFLFIHIIYFQKA
jgi:hypothetical protein